MDQKPRRIWAVEVTLSQEDEYLCFIVQNLGIKRWPIVSHKMLKHFGGPSKTANQCRTRWMNVLSPVNSAVQWSKAEDLLMFEKQKLFGNKWSKISKLMKGRSENTIKNRFYSIARKNLRRYNRRQRAEKRIVGKVCDLVKDQKIRKILCQMPESAKYSKRNRNDEKGSEEKRRRSVSKGIELGRKRRRDESEEEDEEIEEVVDKAVHEKVNERIKRYGKLKMVRRSWKARLNEQKSGKAKKKLEKKKPIRNESREKEDTLVRCRTERCTRTRLAGMVNRSLLNPDFFSKILKKSYSLKLPKLFS
jgi:hypothetical protein